VCSADGCAILAWRAFCCIGGFQPQLLTIALRGHLLDFTSLVTKHGGGATSTGQTEDGMKHFSIHLAACKLAAVAAAITLAAGFAVLGSAGSASAATPAANCSGYSCHGHDPVVYGCTASSTTTANASVSGTVVATVQNRYASNCNANWVRGQLTSAGVSRHYWIVVDITTTDSHGTGEYMCYPGPNNTGNLNEFCSGSTYGGNTTFIFSDMVDGTNTATARIFVYTCSYFPNCPNYVTSASTSQ
jgi:Protein of unknown function (DUF2690)